MELDLGHQTNWSAATLVNKNHHLESLPCSRWANEKTEGWRCVAADYGFCTMATEKVGIKLEDGNASLLHSLSQSTSSRGQVSLSTLAGYRSWLKKYSLTDSRLLMCNGSSFHRQGCCSYMV